MKKRIRGGRRRMQRRSILLLPFPALVGRLERRRNKPLLSSINGANALAWIFQA